MLSKIKIFTHNFPIKSSFIRNFYVSSTNRFIWGKLRKPEEEKLEEERNKVIKLSNEVFSIGEEKVLEMQKTQKSIPDQIIKQMIFEESILIFLQKSGPNRRGQVEFIISALKKMKLFGVEKNLSVYKKLLAVMPEVKMIPKTYMQTEFSHYPKHQDCAVTLLSTMEDNAVVPDDELGQMIFKRFGLHTSPFIRFQRMMYWFPKFKNMNPYPIPQILPHDPIEVGRLALKRMNPIKETDITVHKIDISEFEKTWIVSAQSYVQKNLISYLVKLYTSQSQSDSENNRQMVVYIDGPFPVWIRNQRLRYYILNTEIDKNRVNHFKEIRMKHQDEEDIKYDNWYTIFDPETDVPTHYGESAPSKILPCDLTIYEDDIENKAILASCITGNDSLNSLRTWINLVINENADLDHAKIVFRITNTPKELSTESTAS